VLPSRNGPLPHGLPLMLDPALPPTRQTPNFARACRLWLTVGLISFGGAPAEIALFHRLVVAERRWVAEPSFTLGLAVALLLPGPEAHQLATWLGICLHGVAGGLVAGLLFILPGAVVMTGLAALYVAFAGAPEVSALFFGLRGAVLAILTQALVGLARRAVSDRRAAVLALASFVAASLFRLPPPAIVLAGGAVGLAAGFSRRGGLAQSAAPEAPFAPGLGQTARRSAVGLLLLWAGAVCAAASSGGVLAEIGPFYAKVSALSFGGAYAILAWVTEEAVSRRGWVTAVELVDGLALAETTPGPTILVLQFLAVLAAAREGGLLHGLTAGWVGIALLFLPSFALVLLAVPVAGRIAARDGPRAALAGISAAAVGLIASLASRFALAVLFRGVDWIQFGSVRLPVPGQPDWAACVVAGVGFVALFRFRFGIIATLAACALCGALLRAVLP